MISPDPPAEGVGPGSPILRHPAPTTGFEPAGPIDVDVRDAVERHIERYFGPIAWVLHEVASHLVHIDLHTVEPTTERPYYTLVTSGMSERPMTLPARAIEAGHHQYAELMMCLPADWPVQGDDDAAYWPLRLLKEFARLPHEYHTWVGPWHSLPNGDPAEPYAPTVPFVGAMVTPMLRCPPEARTITTAAGQEISLLAVVPLHTAELNLKLSEGTDALLDAFDRVRVTELLDPDRPSSV